MPTFIQDTSIWIVSITEANLDICILCINNCSELSWFLSVFTLEHLSPPGPGVGTNPMSVWMSSNGMLLLSTAISIRQAN